MRIPIRMAKFGADAESGTIASWLRSVGDRVERGDALVEVETSKVTMAIESPASGRLVEIVQPVGTEVPVGEVIAYLDDGA